jgi:iron complex outermembrane receptor protein
MRDLTSLSLAELMSIEITSVSKKPQILSGAAAAVFVITREDIRRSGVASIPEALRMAPGLNVARMDSNKWAISSRGFNDFFANKLLVLIDGRIVYTPLFSGVFWDVQDVVLEDVDRIEIIRGPGATLWGANAVNGVINIITRNAIDTQGGLATAGIGTEEQGFGAIRYGGKIGETAHYRMYAKYFNRDAFVDEIGNDAYDDWHYSRSGFRLDSHFETDSLTVQGDLYNGESGLTFLAPEREPPYTSLLNTSEQNSGANLLTRWKRTFSDSSDLALQLYYDWYRRNSPMFDENRDTVDLDFQHRFAFTDRQSVIWGLGYRFNGDRIDNSFMYSFDPTSQNDQLFSAFLQDEITLSPDEIRLILGSKFEHNDYSGFEIQPNARVLWTPHENHTFWASVSRAVRTPSRGDTDLEVNFLFPIHDPRNPLPIPLIMNARGNKDFLSEDVQAYELGYRMQATRWLSLDMALFYNAYNRLRTAESAGPVTVSPLLPNHVIIPLIGGNKMDGETYGFELSSETRFSSWWKIQAVYSFLQMQLHPDTNSTDFILESAEGESPNHRISLRSSMDIARNLELDCWFRYTDELSSLNIPSYYNVDLRIGWRPSQNVELSVGAQNIVNDHHPEFRIRARPTEVERSVYAKITWRF